MGMIPAGRAEIANRQRKDVNAAGFSARSGRKAPAAGPHPAAGTYKSTKEPGYGLTPSCVAVGVTGFEPATTRPPDVYSNRAELHPAIAGAKVALLCETAKLFHRFFEPVPQFFAPAPRFSARRPPRDAPRQKKRTESAAVTRLFPTFVSPIYGAGPRRGGGNEPFPRPVPPAGRQTAARYEKTHRMEEIRNDGQKEEDTNKSLDIFYAPPTESGTTQTVNESSPQGVFDNILENSLNKPQTELSFKPSPSIKKDNAFLNYISARKVERKIDYLLLTAYYFTQYEQKPRFTLKQLNAKLMQNIAVIIDHSVLQEAINRDYIECLPDLTGLVGASEYRLTAYGEKVLLDE